MEGPLPREAVASAAEVARPRCRLRTGFLRWPAGPPRWPVQSSVSTNARASRSPVVTAASWSSMGVTRLFLNTM
ncbi:hypothetical protein GCM10017779_40540 [Streptomyces capillispiralis]|nr:hypothetical protein GCM10017779_40540 [Streptomyces capillispiralis]